MKKLLIACCCLASGWLQAQSLEPYVIASTGSFGANSAGTTLSWTVGEAITTTESAGNTMLTQGFHQPVTINIVAVNELLAETLNLQVYPNPTVAQLTIKKEGGSSLKAQLIDVLGQVVQVQQLNNSQTTLNIEYLPASSYFLKVTDLEGRAIKTFKIQKIR